MKKGSIYRHNDKIEHIVKDNFRFCPICGESLVQKYISNHYRQTCLSCGFVHFRNPSPTVSLVIIDNAMILLGKRTQFPKRESWATPSGYIEFGEDFITTAVREAKEETNLEIEITEILDVTDSFFPPEQHFLNIYLLACVKSGQLKADDDMGELQWFPLNGPFPEMAFEEDIDIINSYIKQLR